MPAEPPPPPPAPATMDNLWDLAADPAAVHRAGQLWLTFVQAADAARDPVPPAAQLLRGDAWSGEASDTYHDHLDKLDAGVTELLDDARQVGAALAEMGDALTTAQHELDAGLSRVGVPATVSGDRITFRFASAEDVERLNVAIDEAMRTRGGLDADQSRFRSRIDEAELDLRSLAGPWRDQAAGNDDGWAPPAEAQGLNWIYDGDSVVLNTGPGDNQVLISRDPVTGEQIVLVDGITTRFPAGDAITIRAGAGNDVVDVAPGTRIALTVLGGDGDDVLRGSDGADRLLGLAGRDVIEGRGGDDLITAGSSSPPPATADGERLWVLDQIDGGAGNDRLYGSLSGKEILTRPAGGDVAGDRILGGDGDDLIEGGGGDDTLDGGEGVDTARGGSGIDNVFGRGGDDTLAGGADRDYVDGGAGDDVLAGGLGDDTLYGLAGADRLDGGFGQDYLEGGAGNDLLEGGAGPDTLSGGRDDDVIHGGADDDVIYTGAGRDVADAGAGLDTVYHQAGEDSVQSAENAVDVQISDQAKYFVIEGSPEFVDRVQSDLDLLRTSPTGQQLLGKLQQMHDDTAGWFYEGSGVTIREYATENGMELTTMIPPGFDSSEVTINPSHDTNHSGPPVAVFYHELAHVYDFTYDTWVPGDYTGDDNPGVPNLEREAAGLPIDDDFDPSTPDRIDPRHPYELTENGLRSELGSPLRTEY
ncbi:M91 family zinc metallopeptidase [Actinoplanes sp. NPDC026619]|uniref:M91 family zinc metallopeptidase n=1 Tax=Actinoplanes sp. NPDC026619 TaxID=3155798 RepID=UPI0033F4E96A